ncbi:D(2) dopamine receptor-like [Photinus pyralis]|uniref:D(2) dopamine receptor-like n=1 Tax=Photinus pyralis TaxID=7054 RepID=UPI0012672DE7|nr:D(2) dopamine receptor-like [Photinus pyralis]
MHYSAFAPPVPVCCMVLMDIQTQYMFAKRNNDSTRRLLSRLANMYCLIQFNHMSVWHNCGEEQGSRYRRMAQIKKKRNSFIFLDQDVIESHRPTGSPPGDMLELSPAHVFTTAQVGRNPISQCQYRGSTLSVNGELQQQAAAAARARQPSVGIDTDMVSEFDPSSSDSGVVSRCAVVKPLKLRLCRPIFGRRTAKSRRSEESKPAKSTKSVEQVVPRVQKPRDPEREKRRIARKKEKRATLILGLIMGSFIACWLPFFFMYILRLAYDIPGIAFATAFWLGYMNSALNPVIYTIFNKDFRRAFRRILFK